MILNCDVGEHSWVLWTIRRSNQSILKEISPWIHWKDWCWSWNSNTLATWCEELTHLQRPWCWERLKVGGEGDDRGWDGWMTLLTRWTWVWVNSGSWWWTGRPGVLWLMGLQRVDTTEWLNWTESFLNVSGHWNYDRYPFSGESSVHKAQVTSFHDMVQWAGCLPQGCGQKLKFPYMVSLLKKP